LLAQAQIEVADFDACQATEAVGGDGRAFDQVFLDLSSRVQLGVVFVGQVVEVGGVFAGEDGDLPVSPWMVLLRPERASDWN